jgi:hypothetical protein
MGAVKARYLDVDDCWPGQCCLCGQMEKDCHCDDDLDAPLPLLSKPARRARLALVEAETVETTTAENAVDERGTMCEHGHDADDCWQCYDREQDERDDLLWD